MEVKCSSENFMPAHMRATLMENINECFFYQAGCFKLKQLLIIFLQSESTGFIIVLIN